MNTIVVSIIVIIVLVIMVYLISTNFVIFKGGISCKAQTGQCEAECNSPIDAYEADGTVIPAADLCRVPGEVCCSIV